MWQKCPICNGSGKQFSQVVTDTYPPCPTCAGTGIINELTGYPPQTYASKHNFLDHTTLQSLTEILDNKDK